jgi:hypothetical protein
MNIQDVFPTRFLKAPELQGREPIVTVARVEIEAIGRTREPKAIVYFKGKEKGLKLNKTMATKLSEIAGSTETDRWIGTAIQLYATVTDFGGETYQVVRIKAPTRPVAPTPRPVPVPAPVPIATGTDGPITVDDIPF